MLGRVLPRDVKLSYIGLNSSIEPTGRLKSYEVCLLLLMIRIEKHKMLNSP